MDIDALAISRSKEWERLDELAAARDLSGNATDELIARYRAASADLADMKTSAGRTPTSDRLSTLLARARMRLTGVKENPITFTTRFFVAQLPAAFYRLRWVTLAIALAFIAVATIVAFWVSGDESTIAALGPAYQLQQYAEESFTGYYSENPAAEFAGMVWTNNAWISAQAVLFGFTGVWPIYIFVQNAVAVGTAGAIMLAYDRGDVFILHLLPHGLLELTCVFVAIAAGLMIFWAIVVPGRRKRIDAIAEEGRSLATVAVGLFLWLGVAGAVEGFVTGQSWPWPLKIGIGVLALGLFLTYMLVLGKKAYRAGNTGDVTEYEAGTKALYAG